MAKYINNISSLKSLNKYLWRYKWYLFSGIAFIIISNFFAVIPAQQVQRAFDATLKAVKDYQAQALAIHDQAKQSEVLNAIGGLLLQILAIIIGMALLRGFFMFLMRQTIIVMSRHIEYDLKNDMYSHFQKLSLSFYRRNNTGDMMARISEDVSQVRMYLGPAIMYSINLASLIILSISLMVRLSPELTMYVLIPLPFLAASIYYVNNFIFSKGTQIQQQLSKMTTFAQEVFSGVRVIKSFSAEHYVKKHFNGEVEDYKKYSMDLAKIDSAFFPLILLLIGLSMLITLYKGGEMVIAGTLSPGSIVSFFMYLTIMSWPVAAIGFVTSLIQRAAASQKRINEMMHVVPDIETGVGEVITVKGDIVFNDVSFVYPDTGIQALSDINLNLSAGKSLGVIGRTGSGKSTLASLLLRAYDAQEGEITIDGWPLKSLELGNYRGQIGYVPQDGFLFSESISNNILFGQKSQDTAANRIKMERAAEIADVYNDINEFPEKFETKIGERGITLSGGQKQRVAIARAIAADPEILILDDCFSAIDTNTEARILQNLSDVMRNKTSIIISHRVSTVKNASHIIVLDGGKIIEEGNHDALMEHKGYYYILYRKQLAEKELHERQKVEA